MRRKRKNRARPMPEAIPLRGRASLQPWTVRHSDYQASVNLRSREMVADLRTEVCDRCGGDHPRASRLHEMGHVAWTPLDWAERAVDFGFTADELFFIDAVEDGRLAYRHRAERGEPLDRLVCPGSIDTRVALAAAQEDYRFILGTVAAAQFGGDEQTVQDAIDHAVEEGLLHEAALPVVEQARQSNRWNMRNAWRAGQGAEWPTYNTTLHSARELAGFADRMKEAVEAAIAREAEEAEARARAEAEAEREADEAERLRKGPAGAFDGGGDLWGDMTIERPALTHRHDFWRRRNVTRHEGVVPTRPERLKLDGRVFGRKVKRGQAAVLVDCSGSMDWTSDDLAELLERFPASTVALYSGYGRDSGVLRVVAENGRRVDNDLVRPPAGLHNTIDGPALRWLAAQRVDRRVWISDGIVVGRDERNDVEVVMDALDVVDRGQVTCVRNREDAMEVLGATGKVPVGARTVFPCGPGYYDDPAYGWGKAQRLYEEGRGA